MHACTCTYVYMYVFTCDFGPFLINLLWLCLDSIPAGHTVAVSSRPKPPVHSGIWHRSPSCWTAGERQEDGRETLCGPEDTGICMHVHVHVYTCMRFVLCCIVLCYVWQCVELCCFVVLTLCWVVLCCVNIVLSCVVLCCVVLTLCWVVLCCVMLSCVVLGCVELCCVVLTLCCVILSCVELDCVAWFQTYIYM